MYICVAFFKSVRIYVYSYSTSNFIKLENAVDGISAIWLSERDLKEKQTYTCTCIVLVRADSETCIYLYTHKYFRFTKLENAVGGITAIFRLFSRCLKDKETHIDIVHTDSETGLGFQFHSWAWMPFPHTRSCKSTSRVAVGVPRNMES
jgi:hypothetical protein